MTNAQTSLGKFRASTRRARAIWVDKDGRRHFRYTVVAVPHRCFNGDIICDPDGRKTYDYKIRDNQSGTLGFWSYQSRERAWENVLTRAPFSHRAFKQELETMRSFITDPVAQARWASVESLIASWPINPQGCTLNLRDRGRASMINEMLHATLAANGPTVVWDLWRLLGSPSCLEVEQICRLLHRSEKVEFRAVNYGWQHDMFGLKGDIRWASAEQEFIAAQRERRSDIMKRAWIKRRARIRGKERVCLENVRLG